jgi:hypothetical protein
MELNPSVDLSSLVLVVTFACCFSRCGDSYSHTRTFSFLCFVSSACSSSSLFFHFSRFLSCRLPRGSLAVCYPPSHSVASHPKRAWAPRYREYRIGVVGSRRSINKLLRESFLPLRFLRAVVGLCSRGLLHVSNHGSPLQPGNIENSGNAV